VEAHRSVGFYDGVGNPNSELVKMKQRNNKDNGQKFIGWYRYRPNSPLRPSIREMTVHRHLSTYDPDQRQHPLLMAIFTMSKLDLGATHNIDYKFLQISWAPTPLSSSISPLS
jgi:hypothetical protein